MGYFRSYNNERPIGQKQPTYTETLKRIDRNRIQKQILPYNFLGKRYIGH